jgi:hypothetical protein
MLTSTQNGSLPQTVITRGPLGQRSNLLDEEIASRREAVLSHVLSLPKGCRRSARNDM